jgi:hypothetical protein
MKAHYIPCMSDFNREAVILGGQKYLTPPFYFGPGTFDPRINHTLRS